MNLKEMWKNHQLLIVLTLTAFIIFILIIRDRFQPARIVSLYKYNNQSIVAENEESKVKIEMPIDENNNIIVSKTDKTPVTVINDNEFAASNIFVSFTWFDENDNEVSKAEYNLGCNGSRRITVNLDLGEYVVDNCNLKVDIRYAHIIDSKYTSSNNKIISSSGSNSSNSSNSSISNSNKYSSSSSSGSSTTYTDTQLWVIAKKVVEGKLKSPKSAKFPSINQASITRRSDSIVVQSYVDAENSYGAKIRSNFTVILSGDGKSTLSVSIE